VTGALSEAEYEEFAIALVEFIMVGRCRLTLSNPS